jgi:hypothetical protein
MACALKKGLLHSTLQMLYISVSPCVTTKRDMQLGIKHVGYSWLRMGGRGICTSSRPGNTPSVNISSDSLRCSHVIFNHEISLSINKKGWWHPFLIALSSASSNLPGPDRPSNIFQALDIHHLALLHHLHLPSLALLPHDLAHSIHGGSPLRDA